MSVFNGESYVRDAIESILSQTYPDFEFLIINDGSTDGTLDIVKTYADPRIRLVDQRNAGLIASLNTGIALARGEYIARADADDMSHAARLRLQLEFFAEHPGLCVVVTGAREIGAAGVQTVMRRFSDRTLPAQLLQDNVITHGSVMYRRADIVAAGGYDTRFPHAEDRELWLRLAWGGYRFGLVEQPLYLYRVHEASVSARQRKAQLRSRMRAQLGVIRMIQRCPHACRWVDGTALRTALLSLSRTWRAEGSLAAAREAATAMIALAPSDWMAYVQLAATLPGTRRGGQLLREAGRLWRGEAATRRAT